MVAGGLTGQRSGDAWRSGTTPRSLKKNYLSKRILSSGGRGAIWREDRVKEGRSGEVPDKGGNKNSLASWEISRWKWLERKRRRSQTESSTFRRFEFGGKERQTGQRHGEKGLWLRLLKRGPLRLLWRERGLGGKVGAGGRSRGRVSRLEKKRFLGVGWLVERS